MKQRKKGGSSWEITEPRERYSALPEKVLSTSFKSAQYFSKSFMHYLKKCSAFLRRRIKKSYKGLNTFIFNLLEGKSVQPIWALLSSFIEVSCTSSKSAQHFSVEEIRIHIKGWALLLSIYWNEKVLSTTSKSAQHFSVEEIRIHIKGWALLLSIYWNEKVLSPFSHFFLLLLRSAGKCSALLWCVK